MFGFNPSLAYEITDELSIGGVSINYANSEMESAVLNLEPGASDGKMQLDFDDFAIGGYVGLQYRLCDQTCSGKQSADLFSRFAAATGGARRVHSVP